MKENQFQQGDHVWVRTGVGDSACHEELATVVDFHEKAASISMTYPQTTPESDMLLVKFTVSGYEMAVSVDRVRSMQGAFEICDKDECGRQLRRSNRSTVSVLTSLTDVNHVKDDGRTSQDSLRVTPSPTEMDCEDVEEVDVPKKNTKRKRDRNVKPSSQLNKKLSTTDEKSLMKPKSVVPRKVPDQSSTSDDDWKLADEESTMVHEKGAAKSRHMKEKESSKEKKRGKRNKLEEKINNDNSIKSEISQTKKNSLIPNRADEDASCGLNQPVPFYVEYSKTGRATCRTCDQVIGKGEVRVGHTPLFRGKPGYMVFRHLHCTVFSDDVKCAEDVLNYETLEKDDYLRLVEQIGFSQEKVKEETEELQPDELVQKSFEGEIRSEPPGLKAALLPFQIEGFSWMYHQEVKVPEIHGGILADEMGMGKTIQTIATILDNRPKLQHCRSGTKHPLSNDLERRMEEDVLWNNVADDWKREMDLLKVMKKIRSRDSGGRAGTLVICPVIALTQWKLEIEKFTDGTLTVCTYHGPDRESKASREMLMKYDIILTTYQVLEADFRKMISPNRVACPNCGGKFKIDKLPIHLKYFCGETAQRSEAQARQRRKSDREGPTARRRGKKSSKAFDVEKNKLNDFPKKKVFKTKLNHIKVNSSNMKEKKIVSSENDSDVIQSLDAMERPRSKRSAARYAASKITQSAAEWMPPGADSVSDSFHSELDSSGSDEVDALPPGNVKAKGMKEKSYNLSSDSSNDGSTLRRVLSKQRAALEKTRLKKNKEKKTFHDSKLKHASKSENKSKLNDNSKQKKTKKPKKNTMRKKFNDKKFDDENCDDSSACDDNSSASEIDDIDMDALMIEAMDGAKNSVLHSLCWWRIVLDEAHMIKTRSSQTANAAFSLIGIHRWCLSGTPLQNRVGEFYSLVRFLRLDPMAYYCCRAKNCNCKSLHYRIVSGVCEDCGHGAVQHFSHFNKYILNPIQREGYAGDGRRAMFVLKDEVLDKCLLRRTKETKAADMELPPRLVQIKPIRLHPVEEDFYGALYTQTKSSFNDYVDSGTLLNNYAHIFDLLIRMRQSVDHPYLVLFSKKNTDDRITRSNEVTLAISNGSVDCDLCHEPPTDRVVSTCCGTAFCRTCVIEYMSGTNSLAASTSLSCPSCRGAFSIDLEMSVDVEDDCALNVSPVTRMKDSSAFSMPSLKELPHVATGSILRRINLADFATSSKIEALTQELVLMRQTSPGSKAIVFSQFVNMLDLIRWRLHSDPYLEDIGLEARALHGGMNVKARDACLKEFREDNTVRVLLMSLKAGGVALNLTCANFIFLMDPWWNPAAEMQAIDRTHRLGQYRPIHAVRFIAENTVEERILQLQEKKRLVFDGTVGRDAGSLKMLTVEDMKCLFA